MSEYESSYYEIALTHRQVVVSFVVLLIFVAAVFLCGVWVGKSDAGGAAKPDRPRVAQGDVDVPTDLDGVEEYSFEGAGETGENKQAGGDLNGGENLDKPDLSVLDNPAPQTTLAQDLSRGSSGSQSSGQQPPPREAPPPPSRPQASAEQPTQQQTQPPPSTSPPPVTSDDGPFRPSSSSPAPAPTPVGQEATGGFVVQVFSGRDEDQAKKVVQTLESDGYQAFLSPVKVGSQMRYRVRIGPYDDRTDAEGVERIVRQKYRYETWVTSNEN